MVCGAILLSPVGTVELERSRVSCAPAALARQHLDRAATPLPSLREDAEWVGAPGERFGRGRKAALRALDVPVVAAAAGGGFDRVSLLCEKIMVACPGSGVPPPLGRPLFSDVVRALDRLGGGLE